ncbi:MAG: AAA family ATPase, partial [Ferruginibacter sp.]
MNQQDNKRKFNPDNIPPKGDEKKKPKFNIYWIYGVIFLTIIAWNLLRTVSSAGIEINQQKFYAMVLQGDVVKIKTVGNKDIVRVYLQPDSLKNKAVYYKQAL